MRDNKTSLSVRVFLMLQTHSNGEICVTQEKRRKKHGQKSTMNRNIFDLTKFGVRLLHPPVGILKQNVSATISQGRLYLFDICQYNQYQRCCYFTLFFFVLSAVKLTGHLNRLLLVISSKENDPIV